MNTSLQRCPLFRGLTPDLLEDALTMLDSHSAAYAEEELILQEGDTTHEIAVVLRGNVRIEHIDYEGTRSILSNVAVGQIFAETYAMLGDEPLMIDVAAGSDCEILFLNAEKIGSPAVQKRPWYPIFLMNLLRISNRKNLELSKRNFHTFPRTIRGRVLSYLNAQAMSCRSDEFDIPFNRQQMADYLNLDRSALSAELSRMQADGLIVFRKNHFRMLPAAKERAAEL